MERDIEEQQLDGLVVASCSPKLHTYTFRGVAKRAGLNPYEYTQVNIREQCSWVHTDDAAGHDRQGDGLVRAGIARTRLTEPLEPIVVETTQQTLVIGGGDRRPARGDRPRRHRPRRLPRRARAELGGWVGRFGAMYPHRQGRPRADRRARRGDPPATGDHRPHRRRGGRQVRQLRQLPGRHPGRRRGPGDDRRSRSARSSSRPASTPTSRRPASSATASTAS